MRAALLASVLIPLASSTLCACSASPAPAGETKEGIAPPPSETGEPVALNGHDESAFLPMGVVAPSCTINNLAWTTEKAPGGATTSLTPAQAICASGFSFQVAGSATVYEQLPNFADTAAGGQTMVASTLPVGPADTTNGKCETYEQLPLLQPQSATAGPVSWPILTSSNATGTATNPPFDRGQAQAKFAALQKSILLAENNKPAPFITLPSSYTLPTYNAALHSYLVGESELLFQMEGEYLTPAQQQQAWLLSVENATHAPCASPLWTPPVSTPPACMTSLPAPPPGLANWGTYTERALSACSALGSSYASVGVATQYALQCLQLASSIPSGQGTQGSTAASCSYQGFRDEWRAMANVLLPKVLQSAAGIPGLQPAATLEAPDPNIQAELSLINQWYALAASLYPAGSDPTPLWADSSAIVGAFWKAASQPALSGAPNLGAQAFATTSLNMDLQVFSAAVNNSTGPIPSWAPALNGPVLTGAPLLYLLGDIAQTVSTQLENADSFHDFACRYEGCNGKITSVSQLWQILSSLADATALGSAVTEPVDMSGLSANAVSNRQQWNAAFTALQQNHASTFEAAVLDAYQRTTAFAGGNPSGLTYQGPGGVESLLTTSSAATLPAPVLGLSQAIEAASLHVSNYQKTGMFGVTAFTRSKASTVQAASALNTIDLGLQQATIGTSGSSVGSILGEYSVLNGALNADIPAFATQQYQAIQTAIGSNGVGGATQDLTSEMQGTLSELNFYESQIAGLQASDARNSISFGQFTNAYNATLASGSVNKNALSFVQSVSGAVTPASNFGPGTGYTWSSVSDVSFSPYNSPQWPGRGQPISITLPHGVVNVGVSGSWQPTCALRTTQLSLPPATPGGAATTLTPTGWQTAQAGPSGYYVAVTNGSATVGSVGALTSTGSTTTNTSTQSSPQSRTCVSTSSSSVQGNGNSSGQSTQSSNGYNTSTCTSSTTGQSLDQGTSTSSTTTQGTSTNTTTGGLSASLSAGLRDPRTPFPSAPVGALLLVELPVGVTDRSQILDAIVLQNGSTPVFLRGPTDLYLVENDIGGCTFPTDASAGVLEVTVNELQPATAEDEAALQGILLAQQYLINTAPGIVAQGTLLPDDVASLTTNASNFITNATLQYANIPPALSTLAESWLSQEIVHIERQVEIASINEQASLLQIKLAEYQQDLATNGTQGRFYALAMNQAIQNMNAYQFGMQADIARLLRLMTEEIYTAAVLKYPATLTSEGIQNDTVAYDALTTGLDWTEIDTGPITFAQKLANDIYNAFYDAAVHTPPQETTGSVAIIFPNPYYTSALAGAIPPLTSVADPKTSQDLWDAAYSGGLFSFTLRPEQIYAVAGRGTIDCGKSLPIIDSMGLFLDLNSNDTSGTPLAAEITNTQQHFPITFHDEQGYATPTELANYNFTDPFWLSGSSLYLVAGQTQTTGVLPQAAVGAAIAAAAPTGTPSFTAGAGLSPFTTIDLNFGGATGFPALIGSSPTAGDGLAVSPPPDLTLVINVETETAGSNLSWISTCK